MTGIRAAVLVCLLLPLSLLACSGNGSEPLEPVTPPPIADGALPVVIDTDMAADDWLAVLFLLGRSDVEVKAITVTGTGEAHCPAGMRNALDLAALAGRPEIPVACGRETPLAGNHSFPATWRERVDGLLGLSLPKNPGTPSGEPAPELFGRAVLESAQKLHVVALGPLTNVGEVLAENPGLAEELDGITVMGGAVGVPGNVGPSSSLENDVAEWNFYVDPVAAAEVLRSGVPVTLVPLDATNAVPLTMDFYRRLGRDRGTAVAEFVYRVLAAQEEQIRSGGYYFWDPLAAASVVMEGLVTVEEMSLRVVEEEGPSSGQTLASEGGVPVRVAVAADRDAFEELYLDVVNGRK
jgi:inosine-uridine nucleoside N-ribohydrolase